jgi:cardiolipin synthase
MRLFNAGARPSGEHPETDAVLTLPNVITILRFLGVPLFMWLVLAQREYGWSVVVLAVMGSTDWVDGYVARRLGQVSTLGRVLDPAADRLALLAVALTLVLAGVVQWWYLAALLVPDLALGTASLFYFHSHPDLPVSKVGKVRTALLLVGTPLLVLAKLPVPGAVVYGTIAWMFLAAGLLGHWIAAVNYYRAIVAKGRPVRVSRLGDGGKEAGR